ncbi:unnamed protein product, partial [Effrenium voratum]
MVKLSMPHPWYQDRGERVLLPVPTEDPEAEVYPDHVPLSPKDGGSFMRNGRWPLIALTLLVAMVATCAYFRPWELSSGMSSLPSEDPDIQEKELQCHEGCRSQDRKNMQCLKECMPAKEQCVRTKCSYAQEKSADWSACAILCHASECEGSCAGAGEEVARCHRDCSDLRPETFRTLLENPDCIKECKMQFDNSCM